MTAATPDPDNSPDRRDGVAGANRDELVRLVRGALLEVAPELEAELTELGPDDDLWHELQLDSMDHLNVMELLSTAVGSEIPERDYARLRSVSSICDYLASVGTPAAPAGES